MKQKIAAALAATMLLVGSFTVPALAATCSCGGTLYLEGCSGGQVNWAYSSTKCPTLPSDCTVKDVYYGTLYSCNRCNKITTSSHHHATTHSTCGRGWISVGW